MCLNKKIIYEKNEYKIDDEILYRKNKNDRIKKYYIKEINNNILILINNDNEKTILDISKNKNIFLKKYINNNYSEEILCNIIDKKYLIFGFKCEYCNLIHKHNKLGQNKCKCVYPYSPYYKNGYILKLKKFELDIVNLDYYQDFNKIYNYYKNKLILIMKGMEFDNFNDYLLHNYKLLLVKNKLSDRSIVWYTRYIKQFYEGTLCENYGKQHFPYIKSENIKYIKDNFKKEKKQLRIITTLNKFIKLISKEELIFKLEKFNEDIINLKNFYNKKNEIKEYNEINKIEESKKNEIKEYNEINKIGKSNKIKRINQKKESKKTEIDKKEISKMDKSNEIKEINKIEKKVLCKKTDCNVSVGKKKNKYILDIEDCIKEHIDENIKKKILDNIEEIDKKEIDDNNKYFYYKLENKLYSSMLGYFDLWLIIQYYKSDKVWAVNDNYINENNPDFIKYKNKLK